MTRDSAAWRRVAQEHIWPPYTSTDDLMRGEQLIIQHASGSRVTTLEGDSLIDGTSSWWSSALGHGHPRLIAALTDQASKLSHVAAAGAFHPEMLSLAEELVAVAPKGLSRVFFSDDGSTAVEVALKITVQHWHQQGQTSRNRFLVFGGAYHGDTLGAASLASVEEFTHVFGPLLFDVLRPQTTRVDNGAEEWSLMLEAAQKLARARQKDLAGIVIEPAIQGASGMRLVPPEVLRSLRSLADELDTFLIADEVFVGYGRTGKMWGCDHAGITPDLMTVAKGFTGGVLPMGATLTTERVFAGFSGGKERAFLHGHTFYGHALGARVAREVLAVFRDESILEGVQARMEQINQAIVQLKNVTGVHSPRALGMVAAVNLGASGYLGSAGQLVANECLKRGVWLRGLGDVSYIAPPLNISEGDLSQLLSVWTDAIQNVVHRIR